MSPKGHSRTSGQFRAFKTVLARRYFFSGCKTGHGCETFPVVGGHFKRLAVTATGWKLQPGLLGIIASNVSDWILLAIHKVLVLTAND